MRFMASSGTLLLVQEFLSHGTRACIYDPLGSGLSALAGRIVGFFGGLPGWILDGSLGWFPRADVFFFQGDSRTFRRFDLFFAQYRSFFDQIHLAKKCPQPFFFQRIWKMEVEKNPPRLKIGMGKIFWMFGAHPPVLSFLRKRCPTGEQDFLQTLHSIYIYI